MNSFQEGPQGQQILCSNNPHSVLSDLGALVEMLLLVLEAPELKPRNLHMVFNGPNYFLPVHFSKHIYLMHCGQGCCKAILNEEVGRRLQQVSCYH